MVEYQTALYRNGVPVGIEDSATSIRWQRRLDDISTAEVVYTLPSAACCRSLGTVEPWANQLGLWRNGRLAWYGWVTDVEYSRNMVRIPAADGLIWLANRVLPADLNVTADYADIFEDLWLSAVAATGDVSMALRKTASGIVSTKTYLADQYQSAWEIARELLDTAIDATALGQQILFGDLSYLGSLEYTLDDFEGDIMLTKSGAMYGNDQIAKGDANIVGRKTNATPAPYPVVTRVFDDQNIQSQSDADEAAQTRLDFSRYAPRFVSFPSGAKLKVCDDETLAALVPGKRVNIDTTGLCLAERQTMRLNTVEVNVSGTMEDVTMQLSTLGSDVLVS